MTNRKQSKNRKQVKRQTRRFQLRIEHPQDAHVREVLDYARSQRREVTVIREAITLYWALENGNLEALFEKFPAFRARFAPSTPTLTIADGGQLDKIKGMLEMLTAQQPSHGFVTKSIGGGTKQLVAPPIAEIKQSRVISSDEIADIFLSMFQ